MKLSEAILLGSVGTGQAYGVLRDHNGNTCAMGAAMVACGFTPGWDCDDKIMEMFPILKQPIQHLPGGLAWPLWVSPAYKIGWEAIVVLNNDYKWTRPQIAAWVAELEQADEAQTHPHVETVDASVVH